MIKLQISSCMPISLEQDILFRGRERIINKINEIQKKKS
jgi:hypothetical protein